MKTPEQMREYKLAWYHANKKPAPDRPSQAFPDGMRVCGGCHTLLPCERFNRGRCKDGFASFCKTCNLVACQAWYAENGDEFRAYVRNRRLADPEAYRQHTSKTRRKRRVEHPESTRVADKRKRQRRRQSSPETFLAAKSRRRARKLNAPGRGVTAKQWRAALADSVGLCAYCARVTPRLTMDHIDALARGGAHDIDNLTAACGRCNKSKSDRPLLVWLAWRAAA